jgi:hypothetical protein
MLVPTLAFAEAGSVGGTVGKQNKSLSGDLGEQTPHKFAKPPAGKSLPRTRTFFSLTIRTIHVILERCSQLATEWRRANAGLCAVQACCNRIL